MYLRPDVQLRLSAGLQRHRNAMPRGHLGRLTDDAVRSVRLRRLLDQCVEAGMVAPMSRLNLQNKEALCLHAPGRGGAELAFVRQVAMYLAHVGCGLTYTEAARLYGRDRTTAAHACRQVELRRDDARFDHIIDLLERCVRVGLVQIEPVLARRLGAK
jgi:Bacterial dnaA protein helix-turn-helix